MRLALGLLVLVLAPSPGVTWAATVGGTTRHDEETYGTMRYRAGAGVANRLTITPLEPVRGFRVVESAERLRARGACRQVDRHTARCPWTESRFVIDVRVGGRDDRVRVRGMVPARVRGGPGDDVLAGTGGALFGGRGRDTVRGGPGPDLLHGGRGRDLMEGRGGSELAGDVFYDDETDAHAARDVVVGGRNAMDVIDYSKRERALRIDLRDRISGPERDVLAGVEGVIGGSGRDLLLGDDRGNTLSGGAGGDRLRGRGGDDRLSGDLGDDVMRGGDGDDELTESPSTGSPLPRDPQRDGGGSDRFAGGPGVDAARSLDSFDPGGKNADDVRCDADDAPVESDAADRLHGCGAVKGWFLYDLELRVMPRLVDESAVFSLSCRPTEMWQRDGVEWIKRCRGQLSLKKLDGAVLGATTFELDVQAERTPLVDVPVPLTPAGRTSLLAGALIEVEARALSAAGSMIPPAGYRAFLRAGPAPAAGR